jgi:hypothetical protein
VITGIVETTSTKAAAVKYKKNWLKFRDGRSIDDKSVWMFIDGSNSGWHAAVIVDPFTKTVHRLAHHRDPASANIGPELWSLLLGLQHAPVEHPLVVVHDYIGTGAWLAGAWEVKSPNVHLAIMEIRRALIDRPFPSIKFIHHGGHQKDKTDFTRWNNEADELCSAKTSIDLIGPLKVED